MRSFADRAAHMRKRSIMRLAFLLSLFLVSAHLPARWQGGRTGQTADIPLRPMTAAEAAVLLTERLAAIENVDAASVAIRTRVYVLQSPTRPGGCYRTLMHHGISYHVCSASWDNYHVRQYVGRAALEQELGRDISASEVDLAFLARSRASFSSDLVPAYFAVEVAFLTAWSSGFFLLLRRRPHLLLIPPIVFLFCAAGAVFALFYSPAFVDADWFYQRVVVEEFIGGRGPFGFPIAVIRSIAAPLAALSLLLYLMRAVVLGLQRLTGQPTPKV
ncbi:MAG: hypothetical protein AB7Q29_17520 [Vicinamibacterales bacterium]